MKKWYPGDKIEMRHVKLGQKFQLARTPKGSVFTLSQDERGLVAVALDSGRITRIHGQTHVYLASQFPPTPPAPTAGRVMYEPGDDNIFCNICGGSDC